jgi:hypothetical protein
VGASPVVSRDRTCRKCGYDEWRQTGSGFRCNNCVRRHSRNYKRRTNVDPAARLWRTARDRARVNGTEFAITLEDVRAVFPADWVCPVLGTTMRHGKGVAGDNSPTLDRLNPTWGYIPGNIAVMSYRANRAKGSLSAEELEKIAVWMRGHGLA